MFDLSGKVAIVTGASRGIGFATARLLARQGARVAISSRKTEACADAVQVLVAEGLNAIAVPAHAGEAADSERLVACTLQEFGRLDILVANAGVNPVFATLDALEPAAWTKTFDTNVAGPWRLACLALPHIAAQGGGAVVFVSSVNADAAVPGAAAYGPSKAALNALMRQFAVEWGGRNVRVNAVAPSTTRTGMIRALTARPGFADAVARRTPLARIAEPEDIAGPICFLASDAARHLTGQVIIVDGGESILRGGAD